MLLRIVTLVLAGIFLGRADDETTISPKGTFKIIQHRETEGWKESLHFVDNSSRDVIFEYNISWPAIYSISPDERWILRIQKSGSGDNISWLYFLEKNGSVWRMEKQLGQMAFDYLARQPSGLPAGLYHTGIEFGSWELNKHLLHFEIHGSSEPSGSGVDTTLTYQLTENRITAP